MKNLIKFRLSLLGMIFCFMTKAQEFQPTLTVETSTFIAKVLTRENHKVRVFLVKRVSYDTALNFMILDNERHSLYVRKLVKKQLQEVFDIDLKYLEDGTYSFEISDEYETVTKTFKKETDIYYKKTIKPLIEVNMQ